MELPEKIHWSKVHSPNNRNLNADILNAPVDIVKRCILNGENTKLKESTPRIVTFDSQFVAYQLLEVLAPLIVDILSNKPNQINVFVDSVTDFLAESINDCVDAFLTIKSTAEDADIDFALTRQSLLKAYLKSIQKVN
ncbi:MULTISPECIES: hypothetical protein [unclassified Microcoleus]|uniref:hypothetical protein n=1 Tax=unclassified Microcoleus TaxID=2642155 RepID=UPI002FD6FD6C